MKKTMFAILAVMGVSHHVHATDTLDMEVKKIESMAGCYSVSFAFQETTLLAPEHASDFKESPYIEDAIEYVALVKSFTLDDPTIVLQHVLSFGQHGSQKHWRQDWTYGPTEYMAYDGVTLEQGAVVHNWKKQSTSQDNQWTQETFGVADDPHFGCTGQWAHQKHHGQIKSTWSCRASAALPRRDYENGFYYQLLERGKNIMIGNANVWKHVQDNTKIKVSEEGIKTPFVKEFGQNVYTKIDDKHCAAAIQDWNKRKDNWALIRSVWDNRFASISEGETLSMMDTMFKEALNPYTGEKERRDAHLYDFLDFETSYLESENEVLQSAQKHIGMYTFTK
jgi:hypothetical protein